MARALRQCVHGPHAGIRHGRVRRRPRCDPRAVHGRSVGSVGGRGELDHGAGARPAFGARARRPRAPAPAQAAPAAVPGLARSGLPRGHPRGRRARARALAARRGDRAARAHARAYVRGDLPRGVRRHRARTRRAAARAARRGHRQQPDLHDHATGAQGPRPPEPGRALRAPPERGRRGALRGDRAPPRGAGSGAARGRALAVAVRAR